MTLDTNCKCFDENPFLEGSFAKTALLSPETDNCYNRNFAEKVKPFGGKTQKSTNIENLNEK